MGYTHGERHGLAKHKLYGVWYRIKRSCNNPSYCDFKHYGGRGISICKEWDNSFKLFYDFCISNGWASNLEIDRINNNGNYEPNNCHFITQQENKAVGKRRKYDSNTSGYVGICWYEPKHKWLSRISINGKRHCLGYFSNIQEALQSRIEAEIIFFGKQLTNPL